MPALIFPAPGYIAVDSSSILSTSTWCSSDSLGAIGKLKTQSTIVASTIKLDVPKVSLSRKLTTNSVNFTPSALKKGFRTKSVDSSILTTSTNRLESTVNTTTFVYTQTSVTTTLAPITARERLFYAQLAPGKYGQILPYNDNRIIDVVSSQIKTSVLSKPIAILRPDIKSRISTGLLAKPITILKADSARVSNTVTNIPLVSKAIFGNKLPRTYTTSSIKAINIDIQLPITGSSGSTADTVSWYINDQDILTVVSVGTPLVTLYFARSIYAPLAGSTVGLVNSNIGYSRQISIISATEGSITFTDPGDLPSISSMYIATVTSQNIIDYVTTVYLDNSTKIFDTPSVAKIKTVTALRPDSKRSIGVENTVTTFSRLESTVNTTTFVYTQTSVSTTLAPTKARDRLYYAQIAPGKYGQILTYNGSSIAQGILVPGLGKTANVAKLAAMSSMVTRAALQKPVALLRAGDTGSYNTNTSLPMVSRVVFGKKIPRAYTTATVRTVTTDIVIPITGRTGSTADTVSWYINDQDVLTVIPQGSALVTLYFARTVYSIGPTVNLLNSVTGYNRKVSVLSNTDGSITFTDPGDLPSISAMSMIITTSRDIIDYSTVTYLDDGIKTFDVPGTYKLSRINTLKADNSRIPTVGKTNSITRLIGRTTIGTSGNLQKPVAILRADSSYSSKVYAGTDTTQVFYDTTIEPVISLSSTAGNGLSDVNNLVDWLEDDTSILNITPSSPATPLLTLYIGSNSIVNPLPVIQIRMETVSAGASLATTASIVSFTSNSITIVDPGEIPSPIDTRVWIYWTKARSVLTTTVTSNDINKTPLVNKATFGSRIPRAYTTSTLQTISVDTAISVTGSSGSTADTVSWYINDQDILTLIPQGSALITLYFAKQPRLYFTAGDSVKLFNYLNGYSKQVTIISNTEGSITFTDPGDIPSTSGLQLIYTETQTVFRSVTNSILENGIEIFNAPTVSNLAKSITVLKSDSTATKASGVLNKPIVSLRDGPPIIPTPGKVTSAIVLRPDTNQRSGLYTTATGTALVNKAIFGKSSTRAYTTATTRTVTTDIAIPVTGISGSTADTVSWYINDQDVLTVIPVGSALVTLYFAKSLYSLGSSVKIVNTNIGYTKTLSVISSTDGSVTVANPGDLPSISGMSIVVSISQSIIDYSTYAYLDSGTQIFDVPRVSKLSRAIAVKSVPAQIQTIGKAKIVSKLVPSTGVGIPLSLQKQITALKADSTQRTATYSTTTQVPLVNKVTFGGRIPRAYTTSTTSIIYVDTPWPITGRSESTADTVSWYINDQDILTTTNVPGSEVTLYFAQQNLQVLSPGLQVRLVNWTIGYTRLITLTAVTNASITFTDPGDLPSISGLNILLSVPQTVVNSSAITQFESSNELVDTPKSGNLSKSSIRLRTDSAKLQTAPGKVTSAIVIKADNNQRSSTYNTTTQISVVNKAIFGKKIPRAYTTSTLNLVTTDVQIPVISRTGSTADTVSWYINDQDILTIIPQGSALVTLYFARPADNVTISNNVIQIINSNIGYSNQISIISKTENSVTFADPGDLPSTSNMFIIGTTSQYVVNYSTVAYLDDSTEIFYTPNSGNASFKSTRQLFAEPTRIQTPGKTKSISKLIAGTRILPSANLQKQFAILKADNNQRTATYSTTTQIPLVTKAIFGKKSTRVYTTATTKTVTTDIAIPVTGISGSTADTVSWYINDQDILTVIPLGSALVTLYFAKLSYSITGTITLTNTNIGYTRSISVISSTDGSITFTDPGDLPSISGMYLVISTTQSIIDYATYAYLDSGTQIFDVPRVAKLSTITQLKSDLARVQTVGKTAFINRLMGKTAPGTSGNLQKQTTIIKGDNNQRTATYSTTTQISVVNKVTFGGRIPRAYTTSTTTVIYVDTPWPITGRSGSTADTANWYIYDQDILNTSQSQEATVTLYFAQQNLQTLYPGLQIRLLNWTVGYTKLVTLTAATGSSITFADPGDLPSISGLSILLSVPQTVVDNTSITRLESGNELVNTPKSGNLSKSSIILKADSTATKSSGLLNKSLVKLISGPSIVARPGKVTSAIVLRPDTNQRSSLYTTATGTALVNKAIFGKNATRAVTSATTRTVTTDAAISVTGISMSKSTADTVNWYINDQDILTVIPVGASLVTFFFANSQLGSNIRITNGTSNYVRSISAISITNYSITFSDPGDLPSIGEMYILSSTTQSVIDYQTYAYLDGGNQIFDIPRVAKLSRAIAVKADSVRTPSPATLSKNTAKLVSAANVSGLAKLTRSVLVKGIPFTASTVTNIPLVNKAIFGKRVPQAYTSATTRTIYTDIQISVTGITGSTADTVSWYINDQDILTVIPVGSALVTLYFAKQNQNYFSVGSQVRVFNSNIGYNQLVTLTSFTDGSITFVNPGDLPSISGMYVIATQSQNVVDYVTVSNLDYSTSIFSIPTVNSLIKSQIQIRSPRTISAAYTLTNTANRLESTINTTTFVYTQTSVTTTLAPTTARERLYYAQVAPGRYGQIITYNGSSVATGGILSTATNRLESTINTTTFVYTQTSVTTTLAPTNARERLYYAQLAAGRYGITLTYNGRSIAPGGILSTATNRLESTVNTTTFVYTQTSVITTLAPTTARERLYYAQLAAGKYGITLTYNGKSLFSGPNVPATDALQQRTRDNRFYGIAPIEVNRNLEFFNDTNLMGEISFPVRYQLTNVLTTSNSIAAYIYDYDILTYSTYQDPSPTRTFSLTYNSLTLPSSTSTNANYVPFAVGSTVKVSSKKAKYVNTFTVVQSNYISVTVSDNPSIPTLPDTDDVIISGLPSVYPIASVSTNAAPTTARENLYYFNLSPGLRSGRNLTVGEVSRIPSVAKLKSSLVVKALPNNLSASVTSRVPIKLSSDSIRLTTSKLTQATARLQADRSTIRSSNLELIYFVDYFSSSTVTTSTFVVPTASVQTNLNPQTPREMLYYAQMGPSVRGGGITLTAFGKQTGDTSAKLLINTINKNISPLKADSTKIAVGKTSIPSILIGRPSLAQSGNLQKALQVLKADSSYPTKSYTATDTTSTVYDTYSLPVISRSGYTADTVNWYIDDQDMLTVTDTGSGQITLYFAPSQYSLDNSVVSLIQSTIGYNKQISSYTYTNSSITFDDPGDLPNVNGMIISWAKPRTVVSTTVTGQDTNKTPLVSKAIFGKKLPQPRVTAVTKIIYVDTFLPILSVSRAIATANTVDWYIEDRDVLTITQLSGDVVTLLFARQLTQNFNIGDQIRLVDPVLGYNKQVTVTSLTETSVTFTDPGDLITSNSLSIQLSSPKTINEFQTTTYLDTNTEIFESPTSSNLVKSSIKLRSDIAKLQTMPGKVPLKVVDGPPDISRSLANLQKSLIQLRPDSSYSSPTYTSTTTTSVIYDNYSVAVIGNNLSTADTVNWYINDQDVLTVTPVGTGLVTLYFAPGADSVAGASLQIVQANIGYSRTITSFTYTASSITFTDPGDLPSTGGMTINWSRPRTTVTAAAIGQNLNKIPLVTKALFGKKLPQARVSSVTRTIDIDAYITITSINRTGLTADTVNWYINDNDILTTSATTENLITLFFDKQNLQIFAAGDVIRLADYSIDYIKQVTLVSAEPGFVTFIDPGDLASSSNNLKIIVSSSQTVNDFQTTTYLDSNTEIFESPLSSNLVKSSIKLRSDVAKLQTISGKVPLKLAGSIPSITKPGKIISRAILRPDSSYSSPTYTSTSTTSVVYDSYYALVTGSSETGVATDAVSWYIDDKDILTVVPSGSKLLTLFFDPIQDSLSGLTVTVSHGPTNYYKVITDFTSTRSSITFPNPGDLFSTSGIILTWTKPRTLITATAIGQNLNKIPLVTKALFGKKLPQPRTVAVTTTIYVDSPIPVLTVNRPTSSANTVEWYIEDRDILTTTSAADSTVTLIFAQQALKKFTAGEQIRLADYAFNYAKQVTVISATDTSVTFTDPGDLVTTNSLNILVSVAQTVTDSQTTTYLESSIEIFDTPKISSLDRLTRNLEQFRAEPAAFNTVGRVKVPLKLIPTSGIFTADKLLAFAILKADRNNLAAANITTRKTAFAKLTDDVSIKLVLGRGNIVKLHTGNFKLGSIGIQDPAAQKKEPIQFWN